MGVRPRFAAISLKFGGKLRYNGGKFRQDGGKSRPFTSSKGFFHTQQRKFSLAGEGFCYVSKEVIAMQQGHMTLVFRLRFGA